MGISILMDVHRCKLCDLPMEHQEAEPEVGLTGGWYCHHCDYAEPDAPEELEAEPDAAP